MCIRINGGLVRMQVAGATLPEFLISGSGEDPIIFISNKFSGDVDAAGLGATPLACLRD